MSAPLRRPPGPPGLPLLGSGLDYTRDPFGFMLSLARDYGPVSRVSLAGHELYLVCDPELIARVLVHKRGLYRKNQLLRKARALFGDGLLTAEGEAWRRQRQIAQPAFTARRIVGYAELMSERILAHLQGWAEGEVRDAHRDMMGLTLDIALRTLFGAALEPDQAETISACFEETSRWVEGLRRPLALPPSLPTPANLRFRKARATLHALLDGLVASRRASVAEGACLLDLLLQAKDDEGQGLSDALLRDELLTLLFAGHETTALGLTYTLWHLGHHPELLEALGQESREVLGEAPPGPEHLKSLPAHDRALRESLRLTPPSYAIGREALEPDVLGDYDVAPGTMVVLPQWVVHRDPTLYAEPERFMPDRWTSEFKASLPTFGWFPFGGGPRVCIGASFAMVEMTLALAAITRRWTWSSLDEGPLKLAAATTARPRGPVRVQLAQRTSAIP